MSEPHTPPSNEKPLGERNYEQFADRYAEFVVTKPHNAYYERPATLSMLPDVAGKRVLDAGAGPGLYAEWLLERGAEVVAVDVTPDFVAMLREKLGDRASVIQADLTQPLHFARDASFDIVLCPLVLDYIADWEATFREFCRVLRPGGVFVFSVGHPFADWQYVNARGLAAPDDTYFDTVLFDMPWGGFGDPPVVVRSYRRPLNAMLNPLVNAGLLFDAVLEPLPTDEFRTADPERYERLMREPGFIIIRARKP